MNLREDILSASKVRKIDPYTKAFKPSDLGLKASNYGSFSDHCNKNETRSGKWNPNVILSVAERKGDKPYKYFLL
jgi:cytochrome c1